MTCRVTHTLWKIVDKSILKQSDLQINICQCCKKKKKKFTTNEISCTYSPPCAICNCVKATMLAQESVLLSLLIPDCLFSLCGVSFGVPVSCGYCTASAEELLLAKNGYFGGLLFSTDLPPFLEPELHNLIKVSSSIGKGQTWADKRRGSVVAFFLAAMPAYVIFPHSSVEERIWLHLRC